MKAVETTLYFEGRFSYRRKVFLIYVAFFTAGGLYALLKSSDHFRKINFGGMVISALCLGLAAWVLIQFMTGRQVTSRVDSSGITWDRQHWPWDAIAWVWGRAEHGGIQLLFQLRGLASVDRHLLSDRGLSQEAYEALMTRMTAELQSRFPHVQFGD